MLQVRAINDDCAVLAFVQILLLVGFYCLPLVLPTRVSISSLVHLPSVMKLASWKGLFIKLVHRWQAGRTEIRRNTEIRRISFRNFQFGRTWSCFRNCIKSHDKRFHSFDDWLLAWLVLISIVDALSEISIPSTVCALSWTTYSITATITQLIRIKCLNRMMLEQNDDRQASRSLCSHNYVSIVCHGNLLS